MRDQLLSIWPEGISSVLDLGCRDCWHTSNLPGVIQLVGVDAWNLALERGKQKKARGEFAHSALFILGEALEFLDGTASNAFDAVLAIDLLEHFSEQKAQVLLTRMERVAKKLVVVWTTLGYIEQAPFDIDGNANPYEEHQNWNPDEAMFRRLGWSTEVFGAWHEARGGAILAWRVL